MSASDVLLRIAVSGVVAAAWYFALKFAMLVNHLTDDEGLDRVRLAAIVAVARDRHLAELVCAV